MNYNRVKTHEEIKDLAAMADEIWHEYFVCILSNEQIDYMVNKFQSYKAMKEQISNHYEYYIINIDNEDVGYFCIKEEDNAMFLSKLYLKKIHRGKGYASKTIKHLKNEAVVRDLSKIWLTVNKYNEHTIKVYKNKGFKITKEQVADIGQGYVMDDYIMELIIN